jgi:hypothetical protein
MAAEGDRNGHTRYHSQSLHRPSASMSGGATAVVSYPPQPNPFRDPEDPERDEASEADAGVPDEERGIDKPVLPVSVKEIWREEREREES